MTAAAAAGERDDDPIVATASSAVAPSGWILLFLATACLAAAIKLAAVDRALEPSLYAAAGAAGFALVARQLWLHTGRITLTRRRLIWARRGARTLELGLDEIERAELRRRPGRGRLPDLVLRLRDGDTVRLRHVRPRAIAQQIVHQLGQPITRPPTASPYDAAGRRVPVPRPAHWGFLAGLVAVSIRGAAAIATGHGNGWLAFNLALLIVLYAALVLAHECGHAIAATRLGFQVHWIAIGTGPRLGTFRVGGVPIRWHAMPFSGECFSTTSVRPDLRRRLLVRSAAGPIVEVVAAAIALTVLSLRGLGDYTAEPAPLVMLARAALVALAATALAGADGAVTDLIHVGRWLRASESQLDAIFEGSRRQQQYWNA